MIPYIIGGVALAAIGGAVAMLAYTVPIAKRVYEQQLVRTSPEKWGRECSAPDNEEQLAMWKSGCEWATRHRDAMREVSIENDGLRLYGEYYDFGSKRCVIILPGRCESLMYSYYFAECYTRGDCSANVLVIDTRAHGRSDGKYNSIGVNESRDLKAWVRYVVSAMGVSEIYLHGICVGCASGMLAMTDSDCPAEIKGMIAEGCFTDFSETFKRHMIAEHRPRFPVLNIAMHELKKHTGADARRDSPIRKVGAITQRMLFIFGEKDIFSIPEKSRELYAACGSPDKAIVWLPKGGHSHLRLNNTEEYDRAIAGFLSE